MSEYGADISVDFPIHVDHDFEVDADGVSHIVTFLYVGDEDEAYETRVSLEGVIEDLCEYYGELDGYQQMYLVAHEFDRMSEKLRERAGIIEDGERAVGRLFSFDED